MNGLWWVVGLIVPLIYFQQKLHNELMVIFLLVTRRKNIALILYALLFFPGVILHELSHWIVAGMLMVPTGKIDLLPEWREDGRLKMGSVEATKVDFFRESLIGAAPLIFGGGFVSFAGLVLLKMDLLWFSIFNKDAIEFWQALKIIYKQPDFWLWFYLIFVVSATMMPSPSDRSAWKPIILFIVGLTGLALIGGAGPWLLVNLAPIFDKALQALALVFGISLVIQIFLLIPVFGFRRFLNKITGFRVISS